MNHFDALPGSDEEGGTGFITLDKKDKKPFQKAPGKKQPEPKQNKQNAQLNSELNLRQKEDLKVIRNPRQPRPTKEITDHHAHDRRSGMARTSEPRKGGALGGVGAMKDEMNEEKIMKRVKEQGGEEETQPQKQPQPEALTLEEYYARQGVDINKLDKKAEQAVKKQPVNADWLAKEKLTLMKTKSDNEIDDRQRKVQMVKQQSHKVVSPPEQQLLGFTASDSQKGKERRGQKEQQQKDGKKGEKPQHKVKKEEKPIIREEDFPSL